MWGSEEKAAGWALVRPDNEELFAREGGAQAQLPALLPHCASSSDTEAPFSPRLGGPGHVPTGMMVRLCLLPLNVNV